MLVVAIAGGIALAPAQASAKRRAPGPPGMFTAGMTLGAIGLASLVTGSALVIVSNREWNHVVELASPGPTGFPAATWDEARPHYELAYRSRIAAMALLSIGTAAKGFAVPFTIRGAQRKWRGVALHPMLPHVGLAASFRF